MKKITNDLTKILDWLNGFSFRFLAVLFGSIFGAIIGGIALIVVFISSVVWVFTGKDKSWAEFKANTKRIDEK